MIATLHPAAVRSATRAAFALCGALSWDVFGALPAAAQSAEEASATSAAPTATAQRAFSTDRPDRTESPYSVEPGHVQVELDMLAHSSERTSLQRRDGLSVAVTNMKLGLNRAIDLQLVVEPFVRERTKIRGGLVSSEAEVRHSFGGVTPRLKWNLWGNDGGRTAGALLPYVVIPAESHERSVPGIVIPVSVELPAGAGLGVMAGVEHAGGEVWIGSATVSHSLGGPLDAFVELWGARDAARTWTRTFDLGVTFEASKSVRFDIGFYHALDRGVDADVVFTGVSLRR